jgi:alpha-galactosidase
LSNALRSISLVLDICEDMEALCPEATLLDVTNPMPRVVTAVQRFTAIRAYGFCNVAWQGPTGYAWLASLVNRPQDAITVTTAGLNHFAWLVAIHDRATGEDLSPVVETAVREGEGARYALLRDWLETYGGIAVSGGHTAEYLPFDPRAHYPTRPPYHGDAKARQLHWDALRAVADGQMAWRDVQLGGSWEHPVDVAVALDTESTLAVDMINLPNAEYLSDLPDGRIVEVPAVVRDGQVQGVQVGPLPGQVGALCSQVSDVHELVAEGAAKGDRSLLRQAIEIDPAVTDKAAALQALDEMLVAHRDLLPRF